MECNVLGPNLLKGHLWDNLDEIEEIYWDTSRQSFTLSLINQIVFKQSDPPIVEKLLLHND